MVRDEVIDILRFIGLVLIIMVHSKGSPVQAGDTFFQIRVFDVPLMLFASGLAYSQKDCGRYGDFIGKRSLRILVPCWLFLTLYFLARALFSSWGWMQAVPWKEVLCSYLFLNVGSIGYVWIFRVFLLVMFLTPFLLYLEKHASPIQFILLTVVLFSIQFILVRVFRDSQSLFVQQVLLYALGYSIPFLLGAKLKMASHKDSLVAFGVLAVAFTAMALMKTRQDGTWLVMQQCKYPPGVYYLLYGAAVAALLWATRKFWSPVLNCRLTRFIGSNTLWIYLWHIPFAPFVASLDIPYICRFLCLSGLALALYAIQYSVVSHIRKRAKKESIILKYFA